MTTENVQQHYLRLLHSHIENTLAAAEDPAEREQLAGMLSQEDDPQFGSDDGVALLLRAIWKTTRDEYFGLATEPMPRGTWALACDYMLDGATLQELLQRGQRLFTFLPPRTKAITLVREGKQATLAIGCYTGDKDPEHFLAEFYCMLWHRLLCWAVGTPIPIAAVHFSHARPPHHAVCQRLFDCPVQYDAALTGISFPADLLNKQVIRSKPELTSWLKDTPVDVVTVLDEEISLKAQLRGILLQQLRNSGEIPTYEQVCEAASVHPQTLRRQLKREGTSYQSLKDELLRNVVSDLLNDPRRTMEDVVTLSGYCDPASLTRACKRWFGMTPGQYRLVAETQRA